MAAANFASRVALSVCSVPTRPFVGTQLPMLVMALPTSAVGIGIVVWLVPPALAVATVTKEAGLFAANHCRRSSPNTWIGSLGSRFEYGAPAGLLGGKGGIGSFGSVVGSVLPGVGPS